MHQVKPRKVQLAAIPDVNRSGLGQQDVEPIDVVQFAVGEGNEARNVAGHVEQRMPLQRCLGGAKRGPGKDRQAQIDRRGIRCVSGILPLESEALAKVALSGLRHQALSEFGMDVPVSGFVGIYPKGYQGPRGALDLLAESPGVALGRLRPEADLDVTKTSRPRQGRGSSARARQGGGNSVHWHVIPFLIH